MDHEGEDSGPARCTGPGAIQGARTTAFTPTSQGAVSMLCGPASQVTASMIFDLEGGPGHQAQASPWVHSCF